MKFLFTLPARLAIPFALFAASTTRAWADETGYGRPMDASLDGHLSDWLFNFTTIAIGILFVIMSGVIVWATLMHRDGRGRKADYEHGIGTKHLAMTAIISSVVFFGVDGTLLVGSFKDLRDAFWHFPVAADHPIEVEVVAQQWSWNIRYPGPDGKFNTADDIIALNELHVPVNRPVMIKFKSKDVIHSFYLPNFRTKQDVFPGTTSQIWFQAKSTGMFEIGCAQHCGVNHYKMHGWMTVSSPEEYDQWLEQAAADAKRRYDEADSEAHWGWDWEQTNG